MWIYKRSDVLASIEAQDDRELLSLKQKLTNLSTEKTIQLNFFSSYPDNIICNEKSLLNFHKWSQIFKLKKVFKYYKPFQWNFMYNVDSLTFSLLIFLFLMLEVSGEISHAAYESWVLLKHPWSSPACAVFRGVRYGTKVDVIRDILE